MLPSIIAKLLDPIGWFIMVASLYALRFFIKKWWVIFPASFVGAVLGEILLSNIAGPIYETGSQFIPLFLAGIIQCFVTFIFANRNKKKNNEGNELIKNHEEHADSIQDESSMKQFVSTENIEKITSKTTEITSKANSLFSIMSGLQKIVIACALATIIGFFSLPYGYYILLKVLFFGSLIYFAFEHQKETEPTGATLIVLIVLIILYNPIFLVELGSKTLWVFVNLGTIGYLYWLSSAISNNKNA